MAIACLRLLTFRPDPLSSVPRLRRRIADSTFFEADLPYFAIDTSVRTARPSANFVLDSGAVFAFLRHTLTSDK